ncbi:MULTISPECIES: hypothetical protein [Actinobacteria]
MGYCLDEHEIHSMLLKRQSIDFATGMRMILNRLSADEAAWHLRHMAKASEIEVFDMATVIIEAFTTSRSQR